MVLEAVLGHDGMSPYRVRVGVQPNLFVLWSRIYIYTHCLLYVILAYFHFFPFLCRWSMATFILSDFVEGKIIAQDLGFDNFDLLIYDNILNDTRSESSNYGDHNSDDDATESSIKVCDSYDDNDGNNPTITIFIDLRA